MSSARVLIVDGSSSFGGATTTLPGLIEALEAVGLEVVVAASHDDGWDRVGLGGRVRRLPSLFEAARGGAFATREVQRAAVVRTLIAREGVDVVIGNNDPTVNAGAALAARAAAVPFVQLIRGHARRSAVVDSVLADAAAIFSHGGPDEGRRLGVDPRVVSRWPRLDEGLRPSQWPSPRRPGPPRWFWASTLARWKGLPLLRDALARLGDDGVDLPPVDVCFIRLARDHVDADVLPGGWGPTVTLHEHPPTLDAIRANASVYIHTATVAEPFGRSILEAMAAGLCPVVPDEGGAARLVEDGVTGLVYPARSVSGLASALARAQTSPALVEACGRRAARAARAYETTAVLGELVDGVAGLAAASSLARRRRA